MKRALCFMNKALPITYNTYIGGVSASISTATLLAAKLAISVGAISNFTVVGSDIKCKITGSYVIPYRAFYTDTSITYYNDVDGLVTDLLTESFSLTTKIKELKFNGVVTLTGSNLIKDSSVIKIDLINATSISPAFSETFDNNKTYCLPKATILGATVGDNATFNSGAALSYKKIYVNDFLRTANSGSPDGDITYATNLGAVISYVTNYTAPSQVGTISLGTAYNNKILLNFTAPSSTNAIDYYEVYVNGIYNNKGNFGSVYAINLIASTSYNISLIAVDVFYNKSILSADYSLSTTTGSTSFINDLLLSYQFESNLNENIQGLRAYKGSAITFSTGKNNNAAIFGGTSASRSAIIDAPNFTDGTNDLPYSVSTWVWFNSVGIMFVYAKTNNTNTNASEYDLVLINGQLRLTMMDKTTSGTILVANALTTGITANNWTHIVTTYDGSKTFAGIKIYVNGVSKTTTNQSSGSYTGMKAGMKPLFIGSSGASQYFLNGKLDEFLLFNKALTGAEVTSLYNSGTGIFYPSI